MNHSDANIFTLDHFEGPLDFLLHLIQKNEIDIYEVSLQKITKQYQEKLGGYEHPPKELNVNTGAEFVNTVACLLFLKTQMLLPKYEQNQTQEEEIDPRFEIIHQLLDYSRFKQSAQELAEREQKQGAYYFRGIEREEAQKKLGIDHLCLEDLAALFQQVLAKAASSKGKVHEDVWKISDKIAAIRQSLQHLQKMPFGFLFSSDSCREELIVTFLAILELMKMGEIHIIKESTTNAIMIVKAHLFVDVSHGQRN